MLVKYYVKALKYAVAKIIDSDIEEYVSKDKETGELYLIKWETLYEILCSFENFLNTL